MPEHSVTFKKLIHAPYDTVISFLHTPTELIDLNPLVIHREPRKDDPSTYDIRDRMKILGIIPYEFNYTVKFTLNEDGIDGEVNAPGGTQLKDHWSAKAVDEENTEVTEDVTVKANLFLLPLTLSGLDSAHKDLQDRMARKLDTSK